MMGEGVFIGSGDRDLAETLLETRHGIVRGSSPGLGFKGPNRSGRGQFGATERSVEQAGKEKGRPWACLG